MIKFSILSLILLCFIGSIYAEHVGELSPAEIEQAFMELEESLSEPPRLNVSSTYEAPVGMNTPRIIQEEGAPTLVYPTVADKPESTIPVINTNVVESEAGVLPFKNTAIPTKVPSIPVKATVKAEWIRSRNNSIAFLENSATPKNSTNSTATSPAKPPTSNTTNVASNTTTSTATNTTNVATNTTNAAASNSTKEMPSVAIKPLELDDPKPVDDSDLHYETSNTVSHARFALEINKNAYLRDPAGFIKTMRVEIADAIKAPLHRIEVTQVDPFGMYVELRFTQPTLAEIQKDKNVVNSENLLRLFTANAASKAWANYTIINSIDNRVKLYGNTTKVVPEKIKPIKLQMRVLTDVRELMETEDGLTQFFNIFIEEISSLTGMTREQIFVHSVYPEYGVSLDVLIITFELRGIETPSLSAYIPPIDAYAKLTKILAKNLGLSKTKLLAYADRKYPLLAPSFDSPPLRWSENPNTYQVAKLKSDALRKLVRPVVIPTLIVGNPLNATVPSRNLPV